MALFNIPLNTITIANIQSLKENGVSEGNQIEYKRDLNLEDKDKKEFLADISAFANAQGGDIIYGMNEKEGLIDSFSPIEILDKDKEELRILSLIRDGITPRINIETKFIEIEPKKYLIIVRIQKLFSGPAMIIYKGSQRFYSRNSAGKFLMNHQQLRDSFLQSTSIKEKFTNFRNSRIDFFLSGEEGNNTAMPFFLFYIYPINEYQLDFTNLNKSFLSDSFNPVSASSASDYYNVDGFRTYESYKDFFVQTQLFTSGIVEEFNNYLLTKNTSDTEVHLDSTLMLLEDVLIKKYDEVLRFYEMQNILSPFICNLCIINVNNTKLSVNKNWHFKLVKSNRNILIIPEIIISSNKMNGKTVLKPLFDNLWRAHGAQKALGYEGRWGELESL